MSDSTPATVTLHPQLAAELQEARKFIEGMCAHDDKPFGTDDEMATVLIRVGLKAVIEAAIGQGFGAQGREMVERLAWYNPAEAYAYLALLVEWGAVNLSVVRELLKLPPPGTLSAAIEKKALPTAGRRAPQ